MFRFERRRRTQERAVAEKSSKFPVFSRKQLGDSGEELRKTTAAATTVELMKENSTDLIQSPLPCEGGDSGGGGGKMGLPPPPWQ